MIRTASLSPGPVIHGASATPWWVDALCRQHTPDLWFPESEAGMEAVAICAECPVRTDCLSWAIEHNERYGIWGGVSARGRQRIRDEERRRSRSTPVLGPAQRAPGFRPASRPATTSARSTKQSGSEAPTSERHHS